VRVPRATAAAIVFALVMIVLLGIYFDATVDMCLRAAESFADLPVGL
jgi:hypothetical protein